MDASVLREPWRWSLVSTLLPVEAEPLDRPDEDRWHQEHAHSHPYREVMIPLTGEGDYGFAGTVYPCRPGMAFLFDVDEAHDSGYAPDAGPMEHLWIGLVDGQLLARTVRTRRGRLSFGERMRAVLAESETGADLSHVWTEVKRSGAADALRRLQIVSALGLVTARLLTAEPPAQSPASAQRAAIEAITRHIRRTAGNGTTLDALAHTAGYSKFHFARLFKQHTGCTVHQFVDHCRRERAEALLAAGRTHKEVAYELGFSSPSSFSRWWGKQPRRRDRR